MHISFIIPCFFQDMAAGKGGKAKKGFSDENASWLKPAKKSRHVEESDEEEEEGSEDGEGFSDEDEMLEGSEEEEDGYVSLLVSPLRSQRFRCQCQRME